VIETVLVGLAATASGAEDSRRPGWEIGGFRMTRTPVRALLRETMDEK
jgi:hypothetical protein